MTVHGMLLDHVCTLGIALDLVHNLVQQEIQEFVRVLMHGRPKDFVFPLQNFKHFRWCNNARSRLMCHDRFKHILQACKERFRHTILLRIAIFHPDMWAVYVCLLLLVLK